MNSMDFVVYGDAGPKFAINERQERASERVSEREKWEIASL